MLLVIDISAVLALRLPDEDSRYADQVLRLAASEQTLVPALFWYELQNGLLMAHRRGRISLPECESLITDMKHLIDVVEDNSLKPETMTLAVKHRLTVYDASYLELCQRYGGALATLDRALRTAAEAEGVNVIAAAADPL